MNPPIIKIEIESMRHSLQRAFSNELLQLDEFFKKAIEKACDPVEIQHIVNEQASHYLRLSIETEVKDFIMFGEGRKLVKAAVIKKLSEDLSY